MKVSKHLTSSALSLSSIRNIIGLLFLSILVTGCNVPPYSNKENSKQAMKGQGFTSFQHNIDGQKIHGVHSGYECSPAILFVHGSPGNWKAWGRYLGDTELNEKGFMISIDRPGFGGSDEGVWEPSLRRQTQTIMQAALKEHPGPFLIVGHSFGGPIAVQAAIDYQDNLTAMVILAGSVDPELEKTKFIQKVADNRLLRWLVPSDLNVANQEILPLKAELELQQPFLDRITVPVFVVQGESDTLVPPGNADYIEKHFHSAQLIKMHRIPKQGHFLPWEQYDLVRSILLEYLDTKAVNGC